MRKIVFVLPLCIALSACGQVERTTAKWTGYSEICVDGVEYIQFTSGASVKYNSDGTVVTC